ncbi:hypothetical protein ABH930_000325 [Kitasatospora sp. GAS204A]|uniref:hypothetical protein n=1 Tax=unclassified Kitasatospora TaxID=2633591 RepID=UPI00247476C6|nr:hypothetical protein [Kitasatospora sp. GAS204B]MDH6116906.1 hypothetical protein [Kitasatospora sp. GAS204B]
MTYVRSGGGSNELFRASGLTLSGTGSDTVTAGTVNALTASAAGTIDLSRISNGLLVVNAANAPTGTNPTLAIFFDVRDYFGNWCQVSGATSIGGALLSTSGVTFGNISATGYQLTDVGRIRWVLTGTTPAFSGVSFSLYGR